MSDEHSAEAGEAQRRTEEKLEEGLRTVETPDDAARVIDQLEQTAGNLSEEEVAAGKPSAAPTEQARAIERAAAGSARVDKAAAVIAETAAQSAAAADGEKGVIDEAISHASGAAAELHASGDVMRGQQLLRKELFGRLRPLQKVDTGLFIGINHLPHPPVVDLAMKRLSWAMTGGAGWLLVLLFGILRNRRSGWRTAVEVAPALWLATSTVEYPMKRWFRRRRPFISLVRAIVVGRRPGSYSFPSGHSAAAFAGAVLLSRAYPRQRRKFFSLAALVAFSRVYLGAHYPGDVVSGSVSGALLARFFGRVVRCLLRL